MTPIGSFVIAADHPALPGHFPGRPIVPGVVLLDEVMARLPTGMTLLSAKFTSPVQAGTAVAVQTRTDAAGRILFTCAVAGHPVLSGVFTP